jgi:hypothetical protein
MINLLQNAPLKNINRKRTSTHTQEPFLTASTPTDDGKSSADFLALLSQLKSGSHGDYEV